MFLFSTLGNPCSSFFTCSLCRDSNDLFFFDFVVELLKRGIADGDANCQLFSQLLLLKLIDPITVSLCFLLYLSLGHSPLWLGHFYTCTQYTCILRRRITGNHFLFYKSTLKFSITRMRIGYMHEIGHSTLIKNMNY